MPNFKWSEVVAALEIAENDALEDGKFLEFSKLAFIVSALAHDEHGVAWCEYENALQISARHVGRLFRCVQDLPHEPGSHDEKIAVRSLLRRLAHDGWLEIVKEFGDDTKGAAITYARVTIPTRYRSTSPLAAEELPTSLLGREQYLSRAENIEESACDPKKSIMDVLSGNLSRYHRRSEFDDDIPSTAVAIRLKTLRVASKLSIGQVKQTLSKLVEEGFIKYWHRRTRGRDMERVIVYEISGRSNSPVAQSELCAGINYDKPNGVETVAQIESRAAQDSEYVSSLIQSVGLRQFIGEKAFFDLAHDIQDIVESRQLNRLNLVDISDLIVLQDDKETLIECLNENGMTCHIIGDKVYVDHEDYPNAVCFIRGPDAFSREFKSKKRRVPTNSMKRAAKSLEVSNDLEKLGQALDTAIANQGETNGNAISTDGF